MPSSEKSRNAAVTTEDKSEEVKRRHKEREEGDISTQQILEEEKLRIEEDKLKREE